MLTKEDRATLYGPKISFDSYLSFESEDPFSMLLSDISNDKIQRDPEIKALEEELRNLSHVDLKALAKEERRFRDMTK